MDEVNVFGLQSGVVNVNCSFPAHSLAAQNNCSKRLFKRLLQKAAQCHFKLQLLIACVVTPVSII